jgi:hypothetical protein
MSEPQQPITAFLAIWGAVVSTIALAWNIIRDRKDRRDVKVSIAIQKSPRRDSVKFSFIVTNTGTRPVLIRKAWGLFKKEYQDGEDTKCGELFQESKSPVLNEADSIYIESNVFLEHIQKLDSVFLEDSMGNKWDVPKRHLDNIRTSLARGDLFSNEKG